MTRARSILLYSCAVALGVATMAAIGYEWLPRGVIGIAFALVFVQVLPKQPRFVVAFCAGAALAVGSVFVMLMHPAWDNCADEVGRSLVEYKCSEGPPMR